MPSFVVRTKDPNAGLMEALPVSAVVGDNSAIVDVAVVAVGCFSGLKDTSSM